MGGGVEKRLFIAGVLPGLVVIALYMGYVMLVWDLLASVRKVALPEDQKQFYVAPSSAEPEAA